MSEIDLRLSNVDPPDPEPKRTIYRDIVNLPDPAKFGLTIRYFNYDDVGLYFQITGSATGYTFGTVNLGLLASGANAYINLDEFASRAKPSTGDLPNGEKEENITLILKAYTDSGYTNLKWTYERVVTVHWINSADATFTVDELDDFDDGLYHDWDIEKITIGGYSLDTVTKNIMTDYVLSPPYSLRGDGYSNWNGTPQTTYAQQLIIRKDTDELIHLGLGAPVAGASTDIPINKWMRLVVPLPTNTTFTIKVYVAGNWKNANYSRVFAFQLFKSITTPNKTNVFAIIDVRVYSGGTSNGYIYVWLDDFKILSK